MQFFYICTLIMICLGAGCRHRAPDRKLTHTRSSVTRSSPQKPSWIKQPPSSTDKKRYYSGYSAWQPDSQTAVEKAVENALGKIRKEILPEGYISEWEMKGGGNKPYTITAHFSGVDEKKDISSILPRTTESHGCKVVVRSLLEDRYWRCSELMGGKACEGFVLLSVESK